jgi:hypothetical protein
VNKAPAKTATKRTTVAQAVAPERLEIAIKKTNAAYSTGYLTAIQQTKNILVHQARSFGDAIDQLNSLELAMVAVVTPQIHAQLKAARINIGDRNVTTLAHQDGPRIVLTAPPAPPKTEDSPAANDAASKSVGKRTRTTKAK